MKRATIFFAVASCVCACEVSVEPPPHDEGSYETTQHFIGLDEDVRIVKTPSEIHAVRADGSQVGYLALFDLERQAYRARFGSFTPEVQRAFADHPAHGPQRRHHVRSTSRLARDRSSHEQQR